MTEIPEAAPTSSDQAEEHYQSYAEHNRILRTWLVAYGIGAPVLILSNDSLWARLENAPHAKSLAWLFLLGVFGQVLIGFLNKTSQWILFSGKRGKESERGLIYSAAEWLAGQFWLDVLADLVSIGFLATATVLVVNQLFLGGGG